MNRHVYLALLVAFLLIFLGCNRAESPITGDNLTSVNLAESGGSPGAIGLMGAYEMNLDAHEMLADLTPLRSSAIGESYLVSGITFFTISPCVNCLKVKALEAAFPYIKVYFEISHPFDKGDTGKPPTAINRLDLDVFDLALVVVPEEQTSKTFQLIGTSVYTDICANTDGFTRELENVTGDSTACPYFLVVDDSMAGVSTNNRFAMGTKKLEFDTWFKGGRFNLYLTMGYGASAKKADRLNPKYFLPEFNRKSAWKVVVEPLESWSDNDPTTVHDVNVKVYDWQIGATVNPEMVNTTDIYASSEVAGVSLEIPGMFDELKTITTPTGVHSGSPSDPLIYSIPIANENLLPVGKYAGLVKVLDQRTPPQTPSIGETDSLVDAQNDGTGTVLEYKGIPEFATYQLFEVQVTSNFWVDTWGGSYAKSNRLNVDGAGNLYVSGEYSGTVDFDPDPIDSDMRTSEGNSIDAFLSKFDLNGDLLWVKTWGGGTGRDVAYGVGSDSLGCAYVVGAFRYTVDFNPDPTLSDIHTSNYPGENNIYVSKFSPDGTFQWVRAWGPSPITGRTSFGAEAYTVKVSGNYLYVVGDFSGDQVDFEPWGDHDWHQNNVPPTGFIYFDSYISKFDLNGNLIWAKTFGGEGYDDGPGVTVDNAGYVYIAGMYASQNINFDPAGGSGGLGHPANDSGWMVDVFLSKFDSDGNFQWVKTWGAPGTEEAMGNVVVDSTDNVYVAGRFTSLNCDFNPDAPTDFHSTNGGQDCFINKFSSNGTFLWAKTWGGSVDDQPMSLMVNGANVYASGWYANTVDFDPDSGITSYTSSGMHDAFLSLFNDSGDFQSVKSWGGSGEDGAFSVYTYGSNIVYVAGMFTGTADFDPGIGEDLHTVPGQGAFVGRF